MSHLPAGEASLIEPAGEMWSVVTESPKMPSARAPVIVADPAEGHHEAVEERRLGDVGRCGPVVDLAGGAANRAPQRIRVREVAVERAEDRRVARERHHRRDFVRRRPDVLEVDRPVGADAERLGRQVLQHRAGDGVGDHQRRRRQKVGLEVRVDPRLEIAVARQHRGADEIVAADGLVDRRREVAGVADAGRAAVGGHAEAQLLEVRQQARLGEVIGDHARAGRERGLDVRLHRQALRHRLFREQAGGEQHAGVRRVGARRDRGDQHVAVAEVEAVLRRLTACRGSRPPARSRSRRPAC